MTLEPLTSELLRPIRHGFFTRQGGASSGVFTGLNCGRGSTDQSEAVRLNRARVADHFGAPPERLIGLHQIHSATVVPVTSSDQDGQEADALVTNRPGLVLSVLTADCQPVLFADPEAGVIGAAHAGWRGALDGVLEATVDAMEALGADCTRIHAVIGPTISTAAYEVGPDFVDAFAAREENPDHFLTPGTGDRQHFDLPGYGLYRLAARGVTHAAWTGHCTYSNPDAFYSFRRSTHQKEADYGRLISAITL